MPHLPTRKTTKGKSTKRSATASASTGRRVVAEPNAPKRKPQSVDDYLAGVTAAQRKALEKVRRAIRAAAPLAEECISYGLAAFRLDGKVLVGFGATPSHCTFYPMSGHTILAHQALLKGFKTTKGSIHFLPEAPLDAAIVKTLTRARIAENRR